MQKKSLLFIIVGAILLAVSFFTNTTSSAPKDLQDACINKLETNQRVEQSFIERCKDKAFATAMTATNAQQAAKQIGSSNQFEIYLTMLQKFLMGFGGVILIVGIISLFKRNKSQ